MSEPRLISPMLDNFNMGDSISERNGVRCCPAMEKNSGNKYIVKIISCPASQEKMDAMILSGAYPDVQSATAYFKSLADDIAKEAEILHKLSQLEGYLPYDSWQIVPMENEAGYDVYLLSKYRRTLAQRLRNEPMTHLEALNLGLDLCASLAVCRRLGYLYTDLKPDNVYLNQENAYRIGDIGFMHMDSLKYASLPDRYRSVYTAPEITDAFSALNTTIDIYALGLILYQVFNGGHLPSSLKDDNGQLPPPDYADYEMAEIILKACATEPAERWQDPVELGQALVGYMQRNGAHDTPIVPAPASVDDGEATIDEVVPDTSHGEQEPSSIALDDTLESETIPSDATQDGVINNDDTQNNTNALDDVPSDNLTEIETAIFEEDQDETLPGSDLEDIDYEEVSDEVSDILSQADDLLAHPTPDPVIAPDPVEIVLPDPVEKDESSETTFTENVEIAESTDNPAEDATNTERVSCSVVSNDEANVLQPESNTIDDADNDEDSSEDNADDNINDEEISIKVQRRPKKPFNWLACIIALLVVAFIGLMGYLFYTLYYLQPVDSFTVQDNTNGNITVLIDSKISEEKLYVVCTDIYGNPIRKSIVGGKAEFTGLKPDSPYTLELMIDGFHQLTGETTLTVSTPPLTDIVQFLAVTGSEDGSVVLSFTVEGPDSEQWNLSYATAGEAAQATTFTGHIHTITGLTVGNEYTFTLTPESVDEFTGVNVITHKASAVVKPVDLQITGCMDNKLSVSWIAPADTAVDSWTVRCYNDGSGFDVTQTVTETSAVFEGVDSATSYTVEVTAAGMSVSELAVAEANSITVYDIQFADNDTNELSVTWNSSVAVSQDGWILSYTVDGSPDQKITVTEGNKAAVSPLIPGAVYTFNLQTSNGTPILGGKITHKTTAAKEFSGYGVTADNMSFSMCKTPKSKNWDRFDLSKSDYTNTFNVGTKASFLVKMNHKYKISNDKITVLYVVRDQTGNIICYSSRTSAWKNMWYNNYCELDIPTLPEEAGKYTIDVFFSGDLVHHQNFTIKK